MCEDAELSLQELESEEQYLERIIDDGTYDENDVEMTERLETLIESILSDMVNDGEINKTYENGVAKYWKKSDSDEEFSEEI